eukprot:3399145-Pleurochrysis_carterae.AAC.4
MSAERNTLHVLAITVLAARYAVPSVHGRNTNCSDMRTLHMTYAWINPEKYSLNNLLSGRSSQYAENYSLFTCDVNHGRDV